MTPIFNEYRKMLSDFGIDLSNYDADKLWIDRLIIRGFDKQGNNRKICRLKVADDLKYEYKFYDKIPKNEELETYEQSYQRLKFQIEEKENESLDVIKYSIDKYPECQLFVATSMGKDSQLLEYLVRKVTTKYRILFNNTTCDSTDVYKDVRQRPEIEIVTPKDKDGNNLSLYRMTKIHGMATRHHRWCCSIFKEGGVKQYLKDEKNIIEFLGMRNEESATRANYEFEKFDNRFDETWHLFLPIRKWTELELWLYTIHNNIKINMKYLKGYQRVGCHILCPFYTKSTWALDKYWYNEQFNRFHNIIDEDFKSNEKWTRLNCTCNEYHLNWNGGQIRETPTDEVIKEFMEYKGITDKNLALQYFNKTCMDVARKFIKRMK